MELNLGDGTLTLDSNENRSDLFDDNMNSGDERHKHESSEDEVLFVLNCHQKKKKKKKHVQKCLSS